MKMVKKNLKMKWKIEELCVVLTMNILLFPIIFLNSVRI